ncbi:MAG: hypothetical protein GXP31_10765 [Kiritimatiellaeota bacterium]|nr:hypothetical protein [Kiritimatiellota bacterium]
MKKLLTITVGPTGADITGSSNREIQAAVDHAAALGGGVVRILPGAYAMEDSLHLRSRVRIVGAGEATVLRKTPSVTSPISTYLGYGHYDVSVTEPDKFRVGMGVHIRDERGHGFYETVATLVWRDGNRFGIDRMLNHDYAPGAGGVVTAVFPVVSGCHIEDAGIEAVSIDGNKAENGLLNGCRGGGVFLLQAHDIVLCGLHVRDYNGDGISFQQCRDTRVEQCRVEGMTGNGLHPGSGSVRAVLRRNTCRENGGDGIFYCLRVAFSLCRDNIVEGNDGCGISIGGRDTNNRVWNNCIRGNGKAGICFREADRSTAGNCNLLEGNLLEKNCRKQGLAEIEIGGATEHIHITGNTVRPGSRDGAPMYGIRIGPEAGPIALWNNTLNVASEHAVDNRAGSDALREGPPGAPLAVGPDSAPPDAAAHLDPGDPRTRHPPSPDPGGEGR